MIFQLKPGPLARIHISRQVQRLLLSEIGLVKRHGDFEPGCELSDVCQSRSIVE